MSTIKTGDGKGTYRAVQVTQPAAGAGIVAEFLQLPGETFVTPRVVFSGQTNNQGFGVLRFARSTGLCRRVVVGPFLLLLAAVPAQKSFGFGDGNDLRKPSLDGQAKLDENQPVGFGEGHAGGEFAAEDSVFLAEKIILQSEVAAEKLLNFGDQGVGRNLGAGAHRGDSIAASAIRANSKAILPSVIAADEFLHRTGVFNSFQRSDTDLVPFSGAFDLVF